MKILRLTDSNFDNEIINSAIPVLIDFWASWCPPCKMMEPVLEDLAKEYEGKVNFFELNVDQNPLTTSKFKIEGVPTFIFFDSKEIVQRRTGAHSKSQLKEIIELIIQR